jgi:hypothetical protein
MAAATIADPELLQGPRLAWCGVFHFHLVAAALAANLEDRVSHAADCSSTPFPVAGTRLRANCLDLRLLALAA